MNSNFNRQFIIIDFRLLENRKFLKFIGSSEFATYLVLRRNVWRGSDQHYMGLNELYTKDKLLSCSLERSKIAEVTHIDPDNISRHLTSLEAHGVIKIRRTGRQNIYILGEWVDVHGNGTYKLEWFYLEGVFGISKSDLSESVMSEKVNPSGQNQLKASGQNQLKASDNNIEENKEINTVNGDIKTLQSMSNLNIPDEQIQYVADYILKEMGDKQSAKFYHLVASKVKEDTVRRMISEIKADGAKSPPKVFTYKIIQHAIGEMKNKLVSNKSF